VYLYIINLLLPKNMTKKSIIFSLTVAFFVLVTCFYSLTFARAENDYNGKIVKMNGLTSLYYVASNGKRYVFPSEKIFKSWFPDFSDVITIDSGDLADIPLVGNVLYRPGVLLIKINTDPKIYAVTKTGILRWIETEAIAKALYGDSWNLLVDDVSDSFFTNYAIGESIDEVSDFNADEEVEDTDTIEANHGLALGNAKHARTKKCVMSGSIRVCASNDNSGNESNNNNNGDPYITAIEVSNSGEAGYIDVDDTITITFSEAIDPKSINANLERGGYVNDVTYSNTGGVTISSSGKVTVNNIASFSMGTVDLSETFTAKLDLSSNGKILTITLTNGSDVEIVSENFDNATQVGGTIKDLAGKVMPSDSSINDPTGTFGGDNSSNPYITKIEVVDGGEAGYIDIDDTITITFSEAIDPKSINSNLGAGNQVTGISYSQTGGVKISSSGKVTINGIASFDMGAVDLSETFTSKLALSSNGKILTITLTSGSDVEIVNEDFDNASQTGGTIKDLAGDGMESDSSINDPTGTFGGNLYNSSGNPYITNIKVSNGGTEGFIDAGDIIEITFNEAIDPKSINSILGAGSYITGVLSTSNGGVRVSSSGEVIINNIVSFDMGSIDYSETFTAKLALDSNSKVLTITLTGENDAEITNEDFDVVSQLGGFVKDLDGNAMESDSGISDLSGTFGGNFDDSSGSGSNPYITEIKVSNGGETGYIDTSDKIAITFSEAIEPESINSGLDRDDSVNGISYSQTGGVRVSSSGKITINNIASFDMGSVDGSETYTVNLALNSNGRVLTITLTSGSDVEITDEDFSDTSQTGGIIEDEDGNEMPSDTSIGDPTGTFGGKLYNSGDDNSAPYITDIQISNGGDSGYIDTNDTIEITFSEAIEPESISSNLEAGSYVTSIPYTSTGGVNVFAAGALFVEGIFTFDVGSVENSGIFTTKLALSSNGKILTITLTSGSDIKITSKNFDSTSQTGGTIEDESGNEMISNSSINDPDGSF
jgi:hypothetical protein